MGILFSRQKKTPVAILEQLEKQIVFYESYRRQTEISEKRMIGKLLIFMICAYFCGIAVVYFYYFPETPKGMAFVGFLLVFVPCLVWTVRLLLKWYYKMRLESNDEYLAELRSKRREILDEVKEKETYKVATEILEKFDPDTKLQKAARERKEQEDKERQLLRKFSPSHQDVRRRVTAPAAPQGVTPSAGFRTPAPAPYGQQVGPPFFTPPRPPLLSGPQGTPLQPLPASFTPRLCRPILPRERGFWDKMVDYVVGDGPNNRYALICSHCHSHNGMAMKEDFEFLAFRCAYCFAFNPAKKQRPYAPAIPEVLPPQTSRVRCSNERQAADESEGAADEAENSVVEGGEEGELDQENPERMTAGGSPLVENVSSPTDEGAGEEVLTEGAIEGPVGTERDDDGAEYLDNPQEEEFGGGSSSSWEVVDGQQQESESGEQETAGYS